MPLTYDDEPGSWGRASEGWPQIEFATKEAHDAARRWIIKSGVVPYGSYVSISDTILRLETKLYVDCVLLATGNTIERTEYDCVSEVLAELEKARAKFPTWPTDANDALAVVHEEIGELQKDVLQMKYEPNKGKTLAHVRAEAVQTAAMALRFLINLDKYTFAPGAQHKG